MTSVGEKIDTYMTNLDIEIIDYIESTPNALNYLLYVCNWSQEKKGFVTEIVNCVNPKKLDKHNADTYINYMCRESTNLAETFETLLQNFDFISVAQVCLVYIAGGDLFWNDVNDWTAEMREFLNIILDKGPILEILRFFGDSCVTVVKMMHDRGYPLTNLGNYIGTLHHTLITELILIVGDLTPDWYHHLTLDTLKSLAEHGYTFDITLTNYFCENVITKTVIESEFVNIISPRNVKCLTWLIDRNPNQEYFITNDSTILDLAHLINGQQKN